MWPPIRNTPALQNGHALPSRRNALATLLPHTPPGSSVEATGGMVLSASRLRLRKEYPLGRVLKDSKTVTAYSTANGENEAEGIEIDNPMVAQGTARVSEDPRA